MNRAQICILGTFHFVESASVFNFKVTDKKDELKLLINKILKFNPTKICVELRPSEEKRYNLLYKKYLEGSISDMKKELSDTKIQGANHLIINPDDERINFAFKLAKAAGINYINGIDYYNGWIQQEVFEKAKENEEQYKMLTESYNIFLEKYTENLNQGKALVDIYKYLNTKKTNELQHSTGFIPFNDVGDGDDAIGIKFVSDWYKRNLNILANLHKIAKADDRILILYGAGHRKLLSDFISESPDLEYVDSIKYL